MGWTKETCFAWKLLKFTWQFVVWFCCIVYCHLKSEYTRVLLCFEWGMPSSGCHFPIYFAIFFMQEMTENIFEGLSPLFSLRSISHFFVVYKPLSCISGMNFETKIDLAVSLLAKMLQQLLQKPSLFFTVFVSRVNSFVKIDSEQQWIHSEQDKCFKCDNFQYSIFNVIATCTTNLKSSCNGNSLNNSGLTHLHNWKPSFWNQNCNLIHKSIYIIVINTGIFNCAEATVHKFNASDGSYLILAQFWNCSYTTPQLNGS